MPERIVGSVGYSHNPQDGQGWPALGGLQPNPPRLLPRQNPQEGESFLLFFRRWKSYMIFKYFFPVLLSFVSVS